MKHTYLGVSAHQRHFLSLPFFPNKLVVCTKCRIHFTYVSTGTHHPICREKGILTQNHLTNNNSSSNDDGTNKKNQPTRKTSIQSEN